MIFEEDIECGFKINERMINNIRCADDTIVLAENTKYLQWLMNHTAGYSENSSLIITTTKTKVIAFTKTSMRVHLVIEYSVLEQLPKYKHLGMGMNNVTEDSSQKPRLTSLSGIDKH